MITECEKAHIIFKAVGHKLGGHEIGVLRRVMETGRAPVEVTKGEVRNGREQASLKDRPFEALCTEFAHLLS